jgi:glycosyltransferase involved in cell wall biosynthesis
MSTFSLIVPLYRSEPNLPRLFRELANLATQVPMDFEVVFVIDGSPDRCAQVLSESAPTLPFASQVIHLSRNFGAFAAISAGLSHGQGDYFAVLAADLQEPPALALQFLEALQSGGADIVFGVRARRADPAFARMASRLFWTAYRRFINPAMPRGGVDVFGCTRAVRDHAVTLTEADTSLISLLFWLGFRRNFIEYDRVERREGASAWTFQKKLRYALDTVFNFTDLPIRLLLVSGTAGVAASVLIGSVILAARLAGIIQVAGYTPIVLSIFFFGGLTTLGLGVIGQYVWLCLRNARRRPPFVVSGADSYPHI